MEEGAALRVLSLNAWSVDQWMLERTQATTNGILWMDPAIVCLQEQARKESSPPHRVNGPGTFLTDCSWFQGLLGGRQGRAGGRARVPLLHTLLRAGHSGPLPAAGVPATRGSGHRSGRWLLAAERLGPVRAGAGRGLAQPLGAVPAAADIRCPDHAAGSAAADRLGQAPRWRNPYPRQ